MFHASRSWHYETGERAFALALLVVALPLITLIALAIRVTAGSPVFYRGTRLGRDKRPFRMLKLRTLRVGADRITRGELVSARDNLTIRGGRFLRDTRLDELPQLWNIVRGEMSFIGPRPERPEVLATKCVGIPGYERRFSVRPGLIGISQLFTPHGTPKCYRTLLDNGVIRREARGSQRLRIVAFTMWAVLCEVCWRGQRQLGLLRGRLRGRYREKRQQHRVTPRCATVQLGRPGFTVQARLVDMNEEALVVECQYEPAVEQTTEILLDIPLPGRSQPAHRSARCRGRVAARRIRPQAVHLVIQYEPCSPRSEYMIHQYFLRNSLAVPRRAWRGPPPARPRGASAPQGETPTAQPGLPVERPRLRRVYH